MRSASDACSFLISCASEVLRLSELIDEDEDSVRLYRLGNSYEHKIETMGRVPLIQTGGPMIL